MQNDNTVYVGLDVHKESIIGACSVDFDEVQDLGEVGVREYDWERLIRRVQGKASNVVFVYEAGPCGYALQRFLARKGYECKVCAPSLVSRKPGDRVKTDRRDAQKLVRELRSRNLSFVHVPDEGDEAYRDLVRAWGGAKDDVRRAKQRLKSFLLVHDVRYEGKATWNDAHRRWLSEFTFKRECSQLAFQEHRRTLEDRFAQCERIEQMLRDAVPRWRFYPVIEALQALRGVQFTVAVGLVAEVGDISRFHNPRQLMAWFGLVPSEYSTGTNVRRGGITRCGNGYARRLMIEAAWAYRHKPQVSRIIEKRHAGLPKPIVDRAWDAQLRLCKRFRKLSTRGKHHNVALVAVARELSGFIWDIARRVPVAAA